MINLILKIILRATLFWVAFLFITCTPSQSEDLGELKTNFADRTIVNAVLRHKDSGELRVLLKAPLVESYTLIDSPFTLMTKGIDVTFWGSDDENPNYLKADWAKMLDKRSFYEGKGNVVMINNEGDTLKTNHIYWDNKNRRIYTDDTVKISRLNGTVNISDHGLEASEDFKEFTLFSNHGILAIEQKQALNMEKQSKTKQDSVPSLPKEDMIKLKPRLSDSQ